MKRIQSASLAAIVAASGVALASPSPASPWMAAISETAATDITSLSTKLVGVSSTSPAEAPAILAASINHTKASGQDALGLVSAVIEGVGKAKLTVSELTAIYESVFTTALDLIPSETEAIRALALQTEEKLQARIAVEQVIGSDNASRFVAGAANPENAGAGAGILGSGDPRLIKGPKKVVSFFIP